MAFRPVVTPFGTLAGERLKRAKELYKVYDADESGGIDLKEFAAVPEPHPPLHGKLHTPLLTRRCTGAHGHRTLFCIHCTLGSAAHTTVHCTLFAPLLFRCTAHCAAICD